MLPLIAQLGARNPSIEARSADRRVLSLSVTASRVSETAEAFVHNLSERGLLLRTSAVLNIGESLDVELSDVAIVAATVVWSRGEFFGCEFHDSIPRATVSATLLRSPAMLPELQVGQIIPSADRPGLWSDAASWEVLANDPGRKPLANALVIGSLVVAALIASLFVWALLTAPFSTS